METQSDVQVRSRTDLLAEFNKLSDDDLVAAPVAAAVFPCSASTLWRLVGRKVLTTVKFSPGMVRFKVGELRALRRGG